MTTTTSRITERADRLQPDDVLTTDDGPLPVRGASTRNGWTYLALGWADRPVRCLRLPGWARVGLARECAHHSLQRRCGYVPAYVSGAR